jgi:hypothetical protein
MLGRGDSDDFGADLSDLFLALGEAANEHETGVVFLLDEIQFLDRAELEALMAAPAPGRPARAAAHPQRRRPATATGPDRAIDRLHEQAAREALEVPARAEGVDYERPATARILALSEGYPYFLQEYGKHLWNSPVASTVRCLF